MWSAVLPSECKSLFICAPCKKQNILYLIIFYLPIADSSVYYLLDRAKLYFDVGYPARELYVGHSEAINLCSEASEVSTWVVESF